MTGQELRKIRDSMGVSQSELATLLGVKPNTVARWERGEAKVPKTAELLAQRIGDGNGPTATNTRIIIDPFHKAILEGLDGQLDPETFELCASSLLKTVVPNLTPVRGGSDGGYDGALIAPDGSICPLVTTTGSDAKGNLKRNLTKARAKGKAIPLAIFASPRRITPAQRGALAGVAKELGVPNLQIYEQEWFAQALYGALTWAKRLLGVTGKPSSLSPFAPLQSRKRAPQLLGRDELLARLASLKSDTILVGGPGLGKTAIMQLLAEQLGGAFLVDADREGIANAVRERKPTCVFIDDAHLYAERVTLLAEIREQIGATFRIIVSVWQNGVGAVQASLSVPDAGVVEVDPLDADTIVKVIHQAGLQGTDGLIRAIVRQAEGRPGLAATLAEQSLQQSVYKALSGEGLLDRLGPILEKGLRGDESVLLGCFSAGGTHGCSPDRVATLLRRPRDEVMGKLAALSAAGVIRLAWDGCISVWPIELRWTLLRSALERPGALRVDELIAGVDVHADAIEALIGARSRGARVPELWALLVAASTPRLWAMYAQLGASEAREVADTYPDLLLEVAPAWLRSAPDEAVPRLLSSMQDEVNDAGDPEALRALKGWVLGSRNTDKTTRRRVSLIENTIAWARRSGNAWVALSAVSVAMVPGWETNETDPGSGRTFTMRHGVLNALQLERIIGLWPGVRDLITERNRIPWQRLFTMLRSWLIQLPGIPLDGATQTSIKRFASELITDLRERTTWHQGAQHRLSELAAARRLPVGAPLDPEFAILHPPDTRWTKDWDAHRRKQVAAAQTLAAKWKTYSARDVAKKLANIERTAAEADVQGVAVVDAFCEALATQVTDPREFAIALVEARLAPNLVAPFAAALRGNEFSSLMTSIREIEIYSGLALDLVLAMPSIDKKLLDLTIERAARRASIVEWRCRNMAKEVLEHLLLHSNSEVAIAAAVGAWTIEKQVPEGEPIQKAWRQAVLRSAVRDSGDGNRDYWIEQLLQADPELACEWVSEVIRSPSPVRYSTIEIAKRVVPLMNEPQRTRLISSTSEDNGSGELLPTIVGDTATLFELLLERDIDTRLKLAALLGPPNASWGDKVALASAAGHSDNDIVRATLPTHWSYSGNESAFWQRWADAFEPFLTHLNARVRRIAEQGKRDIDERIKHSLKAERLEAIHGIGG
ncbi:MAG TPA: helix-turn-helix domain-containing protein [Polyangiaceae bacterium]|nr:helix-turn-helix domain-containing protein [Polyangiaceae bacterium]